MPRGGPSTGIRSQSSAPRGSPLNRKRKMQRKMQDIHALSPFVPVSSAVGTALYLIHANQDTHKLRQNTKHLRNSGSMSKKMQDIHALPPFMPISFAVGTARYLIRANAGHPPQTQDTHKLIQGQCPSGRLPVFSHANAGRPGIGRAGEPREFVNNCESLRFLGAKSWQESLCCYGAAVCAQTCFSRIFLRSPARAQQRTGRAAALYTTLARSGSAKRIFK